MDDYRFNCAICNKSWGGDNLKKISKRVARHWNEKHHDKLKHSYEQIDSLTVGGHHVHGNEHIVEKVPIYITAFDVIDRIGLEDGFAVISNDKDWCQRCKHIIRDENNKNETENGLLCNKCTTEREIEQQKKENHSLTSF